MEIIFLLLLGAALWASIKLYSIAVKWTILALDRIHK